MNAFANAQHIKRTENPEYKRVWEEFGTALECPNMPLPDVLGTPQYFEEITPASIRYEGTAAQWEKIVKPQGREPIQATVFAIDSAFHTYL